MRLVRSESKRDPVGTKLSPKTLEKNKIMKLAYAPTSFFPQHRDPNKQAKTKTRNEHEPWAPTYGPRNGGPKPVRV